MVDIMENSDLRLVIFGWLMLIGILLLIKTRNTKSDMICSIILYITINMFGLEMFYLGLNIPLIRREEFNLTALRIIIEVLFISNFGYQLGRKRGKLEGKEEYREKRHRWIVNRDEELKKIAEKRKKKSIK